MPNNRQPIRGRNRRPLRLEALETRANPATFTVTALTDIANPADDATVFTLREAISAANENPGADVINFAPALKNQTIVVDHSEHLPWYGPTAFPAIESEISILGNGVRIVRNEPGPAFRFFYVSGGGNSHPDAGKLTLTDLTFTDGEVRGGNGANGGGGAAGLGGAIYNQGTLTLNGVTLESNNAIGGNGSLYTSGDGGGGGLNGDGNAGGLADKETPTFLLVTAAHSAKMAALAVVVERGFPRRASRVAAVVSAAAMVREVK